MCRPGTKSYDKKEETNAMADPPPPLPVPPVKPAAAKGTWNRLPDTSKYPVLVSGQVSFTTAAAIKDIDQVPQHVYRIQVDLTPRTKDKTFKEAPWTLVARHFLSTIQLQDEKAIILRKKANTAVNKITSPEELPENPETFEKDYAYDVHMKSNRLVRFKILIATTKNFSKTFKEGTMYRKLTANEWFVKYIRLESQGTVAEIGNLLYAHNRFVNQADLINEIRQLIHPTICNEIDITVTKANEYYYEKEKKTRVYTRWPTVICPLDIAPQLSQLIMERWEQLNNDEKFKHFNLRNTVFVPRDRTLVPFNARIENIAKQNEFLRNYQDVTVVRNCEDISADFTVTKEIANIFKMTEQKGHVLSMRSFLQSWEDNTTGRAAIIAINRTNNENEYSLLTGRENKKTIHENIIKLVDELKKQSKFKHLEVGGTKGTITRYNHSEKVKSYATRWTNSERDFQQKPKNQTTESDNNDTSNANNENKWKSPPTIKRRQLKETKQSIMVDYNDKTLIHQYKDVVTMKEKQYMRDLEIQEIVETPYQRNKQMRQLHNAKVDETSSITKETQLSTLTDYTCKERQMTTTQQLQEILNSTTFQETLAKIVAPQVNNLIAPTVKKINQIETQVGDLHNHVQNNNQWQQQQSTRQEELQKEVNSISTGMQQVQDSMAMMMQMYMEKEMPSGVKRPAPNGTGQVEIIQSPQRRQRKHQQKPNDSLITQESIQGTTYDSDSDMAHKPNRSIETFPTSEENNASMQDLSEGEGES